MKKQKIILTFLMSIMLITVLCSCQGPQGEQGPKGEAGANGENGSTPEFRVNSGWVQWKYEDAEDTEWKNLYEYGTLSEGGYSNDNNSDNSSAETKYTVTTVSTTDDYGLAGTYTMLNAKKYTAGDKVELSASVNKGYNFEGWYIGDTLLSKELNYSYTVQAKNVTITATFSAYTVSTTSTTHIAGAAGHYTSLYNQKISEGETVELVATVNEGYNFEGWFVGDICISRSLTYNHVMEKENVSFEARYSVYHLTTIGVVKNANGITQAGFNAGTYTQYANEKFSVGESVALTATVDEGYNFVGWYIDGNCVSTSLNYTVNMGKSDVTVEAVYNYYTLSTSAKYTYNGFKDSFGDNTSVFDEFSPSSMYITPIYNAEKISVGTSVSIEAKDIEGYTFYAWRNIDSILCMDKAYTFIMSEGDADIYALYVHNT